MLEHPEHLIVQVILAAQARHEDPVKAAEEAARAYTAGLEAFNRSSDPNGRYLQAAADAQKLASGTNESALSSFKRTESLQPEAR